MFRTDSDLEKAAMNTNKVFSNISTLNIEVVSEIQTELEPYDNISLVFLLYDNPNTALERLIVYQRVAKDEEARNMNLLCDWVQHAQTRNAWKFEFIEALAVCQLYNIIRKLGFHVQSVKEYYKPEETYVSFYLNPMKKALYKLSENVTSSTLLKLQGTLETYNISVNQYEAFELCLLELMCQKFISVNTSGNDKFSQNVNNIENLTKIIRYLPDLKKFSSGLLELQNKLNGPITDPVPTDISVTECTSTDKGNKENNNDKIYLADFYDVMNLLEETEADFENIKTDNIKKENYKNTDMFEIKNKNRIGVCYIINQEKFCLTKESVKLGATLLDDRYGSTRDKDFLKATMEEFKFEVIPHDNLGHKKMLQCIKDIVKYRVQHDDSIFMLCILSHGVKDHVYAADCCKINVYDDIQKLLYSDEMPKHFLEIPKILIIQACQVVDKPHNFVADAPTFNNNHLEKSEFLIYWATAPELEAFRDEKKGSLFIQFLCYVIHKYGKYEHLNDIFTRVNACVKHISLKFKCNQVAIFYNTLTKKLYLQNPIQKV